MSDMKRKILQAKGIRISFWTNNGTVKAVRDVSFDLYQGETFAIVGESGSGKSVTAKAIMGILAPNAIIESGEIIYDGKDLLKIPEDEFHQLRGTRLSMIFQDPLSSLNPIMRVGRQMTEAMILNNKGRRRDSRRNVAQKLKHLGDHITAASGGNAEVRAQTAQKIKRFRAINKQGAELAGHYMEARDGISDTLGALNDLDILLIGNDVAQVRDVLAEIDSSLRRVYDPYLVDRSDEAVQGAAALVKQLKKRYAAADKDRLQAALKPLGDALRAADSQPEPDFVAYGYMKLMGERIEAKGQAIDALNKKANQALDNGFLNDFLKDVRVGIEHAAGLSREKRREAARLLEEMLPVFEQQPLQRSACRSAIRRLSAAVEEAIDRLSLHKDSLSYVFRSTMSTALDQYFQGVRNNPRELERVRTETAKREQDIARGKAVPSVVPASLVDTEHAYRKLGSTIRELAAHFRAGDDSDISADDRARALVRYLEQQSAMSTGKLSKATARRKALSLMDEVGIPEPRKRYHQFPFEFSGGMRQRVVIAIALSADPEILICDEPTTALDVTIQAQILELINDLKRRRNLSVIFITHDLGVVANMADRIAVMYAGKIVEYGTADDVFYDPRHPYTWALLSSMPDLETKERLASIPGTPPNMIIPPEGDAFALRNQYALEIDFEQHPPFFRVNDTHYAATWLMHPQAPKVEPPRIVTERIERMQRMEAAKHE